MKTLKFTPELCRQIQAGIKTSTWRLFDDKDLQTGDRLQFINKETLRPFGTATVTTLRTKTLGTLTDADWDSHERFPSEAEMYETFRQYYGDRVSPETELKVISFTFTPSPDPRLLAQSFLLLLGTLFSWYTVYTDFVAFFATYDTIFRVSDCVIPNPLTQPCFYGAFAFLGAFVWSLVILHKAGQARLFHQKRLVYLLVAGTIFGWLNFANLLRGYYAAKQNAFTCVVEQGASPFVTPCFIGSVLFLVCLVAGTFALRALNQNRLP